MSKYDTRKVQKLLNRTSIVIDYRKRPLKARLERSRDFQAVSRYWSFNYVDK